MTISLSGSFNNPAQEGLFGPHAAKYGPILLLMGLKPVFLTSQRPNIFDARYMSLIDDAVSQGRLKRLALPYDRMLDGQRLVGTDMYYCQPDKEDNARELSSIFNVRHSRENFLSKVEHVRIGQLLGYNENDCSLFGQDRYTPEQITWLRQTNDQRRALRYGGIVTEFEYKMRSDPEALLFP